MCEAKLSDGHLTPQLVIDFFSFFFHHPRFAETGREEGGGKEEEEHGIGLSSPANKNK